jgi:hypothetical protein
MSSPAVARLLQPTHRPPSIQPTQASPTILENSNRLLRALSNGLYYIYQRKYGLEGEARFSRFQKWYHQNIWLRFARFSKRVVGVPAGDGIDKNGDIFFVEHQGWCFEEWEAEQAIRLYKSGGYHLLPVSAMLPAETMPEPIQHVVQANGVIHRNGHSTAPIPKADLVRLAAQTSRSKESIRGVRHPST